MKTAKKEYKKGQEKAAAMKPIPKTASPPAHRGPGTPPGGSLAKGEVSGESKIQKAAPPPDRGPQTPPGGNP